MLDPYSLFSYESHVDSRTVRARTLVVTLASFVDAGHAQRLVNDHLLNTLTSHRIGRFDADQLLTYREQRPTIVYARDHFTGYVAPEIALHEVTDADGEHFLLLTGPEPGLQWERVAAAVDRLVDAHDVERVVFAHAMPMPVPHTRPVVVTRYATRSDLLEGESSPFGTIIMSASFPAVLSQRLGEKGRDAIGITAHVPHYLAETDFPDAAIALIEGLRRTAGLAIPTLQLAVAAGVVRAQIGQQIEASEELSEHIAELEQQYDEFTRRRTEIAAAEADLPSADEIGEAAEEFLKTLGDDESDAASDDEQGPQASS